MCAAPCCCPHAQPLAPARMLYSLLSSTAVHVRSSLLPSMCIAPHSHRHAQLLAIAHVHSSLLLPECAAPFSSREPCKWAATRSCVPG